MLACAAPRAQESVRAPERGALERAPIAASARPEAGDVECALELEIAHFYDCLAHARWDVMVECFWPDAQLFSVRPRAPGEAVELVGVPLQRYLTEAEAHVRREQPLEIERAPSRIDRQGSVAHARVEFQATDRSGDAPQSWRGVDSFLWVQHGAQWRIAALVLTVEAPHE